MTMFLERTKLIKQVHSSSMPSDLHSEMPCVNFVRDTDFLTHISSSFTQFFQIPDALNYAAFTPILSNSLLFNIHCLN